jgi:hypothetical protein
VGHIVPLLCKEWRNLLSFRSRVKSEGRRGQNTKMQIFLHLRAKPAPGAEPQLKDPLLRRGREPPPHIRRRSRSDRNTLRKSLAHIGVFCVPRQPPLTSGGEAVAVVLPLVMKSCVELDQLAASTSTQVPLNAAVPQSASMACSSVKSLMLAPACF